MKTKLETLLYANHEIELIESIFNYATFDFIIEEIEDNNLLDVDIIYYTSALDYLRDNDPSLRFAFEAAAEYGFDCSNLNSEVLASLLATKENSDEFYNNIPEYREMFDNILEMLELFSSEELQKIDTIEQLIASNTFQELPAGNQEDVIYLFNEIIAED